ncbi:hypothetical protein [Streptomyces sp. TRM64462]|uniref:hypothetical protein n=1 Tax=Streptomyces sp. TRM64462 TaxID=2741726 RepID=UPI001586A79C|nr:hypothetical protein [Streptomyces sp. TRM64462]
MSPRGQTQTEVTWIGVRPAAEVEVVYQALDQALADGFSAGDGRTAALAEGAADAYRWALARDARGPITGARGNRPVPTLWTLTAEADAAAVLIDDPACPADARDYALGVHDALAWLCGHSDQQP